MRSSFFLSPILVISLLTALPAAAQPNVLTSEEKADGWRLLFDGKTLNGWVAIGKTAPPEKGWVVEDGNLKHVAKGGGGDIVTAEMFEDFELYWEWKVAPAANGGLKYNLPDPKKGLGCEYQLMDDQGHPDGQRGGRLHQTGGLYDVLEPLPAAKPKPVGEWNTSRILVKGNHVEHWLNDVKSADFEFGSDALKAAIAKSKFKNAQGWGIKTKSPILLQDHGDEIALRSIRIRKP
jgi:hypothetical protein